MITRAFLTRACFFGAVCFLVRADWLTFGGDPQRDAWARDETTLTKDNVKHLKIEWKIQLDHVNKEMNSLTPPVVVEKLMTPRGFKDVVIVAGASDIIYAIDVDTGKIMWQKKFSIEGMSKMKPSFLCPNALNATPVIDRERGARTIYAVSSDGKLHGLNAVNGEDRFAPVQFVPPFSKNWSLNLIDGVLYTALSQGCNFAKSAVYAMDVKNPGHPVTSFVVGKSAGSGIWGRAGAAIASDGRVYVETGDGSYDPQKNNFSDSFVALSPRELKLVDYYTPTNRAYLTHKDLDMGCISPVVFPFSEWELVAGGGKEGVLFLLDTKSLGGPDHHTPLFRSPRYTNEEVNLAGRGFWGAFAAWEDEQKVRWLYAPAFGPQATNTPNFPITYGSDPHGSVMAFRVEKKDGKPVLSPVWRSRDLAYPEPPIVANGVVYSVASGENVQSIHESGRLLTSQERISSHEGNAVLHAFDAQTGKELYSSTGAMQSFAHFSGMALANGHIYVENFDDMLYSFGLGMEP